MPFLKFYSLVNDWDWDLARNFEFLLPEFEILTFAYLRVPLRDAPIP